MKEKTDQVSGNPDVRDDPRSASVLRHRHASDVPPPEKISVTLILQVTPVWGSVCDVSFPRSRYDKILNADLQVQYDKPPSSPRLYNMANGVPIANAADRGTLNARLPGLFPIEGLSPRFTSLSPLFSSRVASPLRTFASLFLLVSCTFPHFCVTLASVLAVFLAGRLRSHHEIARTGPAPTDHGD